MNDATPMGQSEAWIFGPSYGPLDDAEHGPFRGRRLTWAEYEGVWPIVLTGRAFYAKVPDDHQYRRAGISWIVGYGYVGSLRQDTHTVTEHEDGTISVTPSLIIDGANGERWHGFLNNGVFTGGFELYATRA